MYLIDFFKISGFVSLLMNGLLAALVYKKSKKSKLGVRFALFSICIGLWSVGSAYVNVFADHDLALFSLRQAYIFGVFVPPLFLHFITTLIGWDTQSKAKLIQTLSYVFSFVLLFFTLTPFFIKDYRVIEGFAGYRIDAPGLIYYLFAIYFVLSIPATLILLIYYYKLYANEKKKKQLRLVFLGYFFGCIGGMEYFLGVFNFMSRPPMDDYMLVATFLSMAIAILRYQLLDIQIIIRKTLVFAGLLGFVFAIYASVTLFVRNVLNDFFYVRPIWSNLISIFLVVLGYDPLRSFLINLTDKYLFQKGYDYHKVLKDASKGMSKIENLKHLIGLVLHFVTMKMRVESAAVFSYDMGERIYRVVASRGFKAAPRVSLASDHPLIRILSSTHDALRVDDAREHAQHSESKQVARDYQIISEEMSLLGAECAIPSFLSQDLKNILLIGRKKSGEAYTTEDISLLMTLAQESAIAIENARLYDEAIKKQKQLGQINEQLEHSKKMLVTALAQAEGANKQLQDTQAQLIHEQKMATLGRLAASVGHEVNNPLTILSMNVSRAILKYRKNPDLKVSEILDVFDKMEKNIERIKAVVNTLTGLLKKSEKGKFEPLSLKLILEETLPLVQFQTYMDNLSGTEVELNVPGNIPLIRADLERLQEIFLNLFINAYHAMANKRFRKIRVDAEIDPDDKSMVAVHFTDNGSGMTDEIMKKIFNYGFTTKPPGKGSGMGLYMCKYIVELHGGTIRVKSKLGEGTTFTVTVPIYQDEQTVAGGRTPSPPESSKSSVA